MMQQLHYMFLFKFAMENLFMYAWLSSHCYLPNPVFFGTVAFKMKDTAFTSLKQKKNICIDRRVLVVSFALQSKIYTSTRKHRLRKRH